MSIQLENNESHLKVMLVDDSFIDNFVNQKIITRYGFAKEILSFTKSKEALGFLNNLNNSSDDSIPSVLFLDLDMPEINGYQFLAAFDLLSEKIKKNISIVILTSGLNPADEVKCNKHNSVLTLLHKPLVKHNLEEVDQLISKKNSKFSDVLKTLFS